MLRNGMSNQPHVLCDACLFTLSRRRAASPRIGWRVGCGLRRRKNNSTAHSACGLHGPALVCRRRAQDPAAAASRNRSFIAFFSGKRSRVFVLGLGRGFVAEGVDVDGRCSCDSGCQIFGRLMHGWFKAGEAQRLLSRKMGKRCERTLGFLEDSW